MPTKDAFIVKVEGKAVKFMHAAWARALNPGAMEELVQHFINGLNLGAIYALIALGYTMVYGVLQLINFAHSEVYMVGAFAAYYGAMRLHLTDKPGWGSFAIALLISMTACALLGLCIERLAYRPLRNAP